MPIVRSQGRNHYNSSFEETIREVPAAMSMMIDSMVNMVQTSRQADHEITSQFESNDD